MTTVSQKESVIIRSLPIKKKFKRFVTLKFSWLVRHNGPKYAADVFSEYRTLLLRYLSGELSRDSFLESQRLSRRFSREAIDEMRSNPHMWLDLLKIYTSFGEPVQPVKDSARDTHLRITRQSSPEEIGTAISIARTNFYSELNSRLHYVARVAFARARRARKSIELPGPSWYTDAYQYTSDTYQDDVLCAHSLIFDKRIGRVLEPVLERMDTDFDFVEAGYDITPVGLIHHIPKKGTVKRRAIAVPNRFVQAGLEPLRQFCLEILERMPEDCTFDQNKFTSRVSQTLREGNYVGSADLSAASDNLPRQIGLDYLQSIAMLLPPKKAEIILDDLSAFEAVCEGPWENDEFFDSFETGQPLGTLPSFPILALSNHLICRASIIAKYGKYIPNKYAVLGDDVIFFDKDVRSLYMELITNLGTPMSLHKSFEGRLVEFAGRIFIQNQPPSYSPDHSIVHWGNLFDYQRSAKVLIPYEHLPMKVERRWRRHLTISQARRAYTIVQALETGLVPSTVLDDEALVETVARIAFLHLHKTLPPQADSIAYLTPVYGKLVNTANSDGYSIRDKSSEPSDWFRIKYRPYSTDLLKTAVTDAILSLDSTPAVEEGSADE